MSFSQEKNVSVTFLTRTELPTEPGWYWARYYLSPEDSAPIPRLVSNAMDPFTDVRSLRVISTPDTYPVDDYIWFGPLPYVLESQSAKE